MCVRFIYTILKPTIRIRNCKFIHKYVYNMETAYFRQMEDSDQFQLTFQYTNAELKIDRQFNFCRRLSENVDTLLNRVCVNVEKVYIKRNKKKKKSAEQQQDNASFINVKLYYDNDTEVDGKTLCEQLFTTGDNLVLKLIDKRYRVVVNHPWVNGISLPTSLLAGFPLYPTKFDAYYTDTKHSDFKWFKSVDQKTTWHFLGDGYIFTPNVADIDSYVKLACTPKNDKLSGPIVEVISTATVQASPGLCPFETRHRFTRESLSGNEIRVVSYNILADLYCDSDFSRTVLFPYCPPYALAIDYRKQLILKELIGYNADIICLQEVDHKVHDCDLRPTLCTIGLNGVFHKKGLQLNEGLACYYRASRFNMLDSSAVVLGDTLEKDLLFADLFAKVSLNTQLKDRVVARTTSLQTTVLESLDNDEIVVVANIHLYFHPDADHIRLLQGGIAIVYVENLIKHLQIQHPTKRVSLLFCGDFNSVPECGIYKLFTTGSVSEDCIDWNSNAEEAVKNVSFTQPYAMASACGTPKYTNYTVAFADCLDYIYYNTEQFEVTQVIPLPCFEELSQHTALPSVVFPSDHVALISDLKWT